MSTHNEIALAYTVVLAFAVPIGMVAMATTMLAVQVAGDLLRAAKVRRERAAKAAKATGACARVDLAAIRRDLALETSDRARRVRARVEGKR